MTNIELASLINTIADGVDPETGEFFDELLLADQIVYNSIKKLRRASRTVHRLGVLKHESQNRLNRPSNKIFEELKSWRLGEAQTLGVPAFTIFSDADLWAIAEGDVVEKKDLLRIHGIGMQTYEKYGDQIYSILHPYILNE